MKELGWRIAIFPHFEASALEHIIGIYTHGTAHWVFSYPFIQVSS